MGNENTTSEGENIFEQLDWDCRRMRECILLYEKLNGTGIHHSEVISRILEALYSHIVITLVKCSEEQRIDNEIARKTIVSIYDLIKCIPGFKRDKTSIRRLLRDDKGSTTKIRNIRNARIAHADKTLHIGGEKLILATNDMEDLGAILKKCIAHKSEIDTEKWKLSIDEMKHAIGILESTLDKLRKFYGRKIPEGVLIQDDNNYRFSDNVDCFIRCLQ